MSVFSDTFTVGLQGTDSEDAYLHGWLGKPGFIPGHNGLWSVAYMVGNNPWAVGIAFHRKSDAELCRDWLQKNNYTPERYHIERDEVVEAIKREVMSNLAW